MSIPPNSLPISSTTFAATRRGALGADGPVSVGCPALLVVAVEAAAFGFAGARFRGAFAAGCVPVLGGTEAGSQTSLFPLAVLAGGNCSS